MEPLVAFGGLLSAARAGGLLSQPLFCSISHVTCPLSPISLTSLFGTLETQGVKILAVSKSLQLKIAWSCQKYLVCN